jgi:uncharacterized protein (TIGR00299 family) protein
MKAIYFDCISGISGDMCLGALIHAGVPLSALERVLASLPLGPIRLSVDPVTDSGIAALSVRVDYSESESHRHYREVSAVIEAGELPDRVKAQAKEVFWNLAVAEAGVHGISPEEVHFHEVGAVDAIVDIVCTLWALDWLKVERIFVSALPVGRGFVSCEHGNLPLPAPAVLELIKGKLPLYGIDIDRELVTPTGAALVATLAEPSRTWPAMVPERIGYGAGTRRTPSPNLLRVVVGDCGEETPGTDAVLVLESNIDDMNPEFFQHLMGKLFAAGALDVFLTPVQMKKTRPGTLITVLGHPRDGRDLADIMFAETTTLGIRFREEKRFIAGRDQITVTLPEGSVRVKCGRGSTSPLTLNLAPELDDCEQLARATGMPLKYLYESAKREAFRLLFEKKS